VDRFWICHKIGNRLLWRS